MSERIIHDALTLQVPDSFRDQTPEEMNQLYGGPYDKRWAAWDRDLHVILAVFWQDNTGLLGLLTHVADPKSVAESNQKKMARCKASAGYQLEKFFPAQIAGQPAYGYRYSYQVGDITQVGEAISFLQGKTCYTVYYYARLDDQEPARRQVFEEVLRSAALRP